MRRMFSKKQLEKIAQLVAQAEIEKAEASEIYELPNEEPTQSQLEEAMKHKFIILGGYVFTLFFVFESSGTIQHSYGCVYGADDGIQNAGLEILELYYMAEEETHYVKNAHSYLFGDMFYFGSSENGKVLVVVDGGEAKPIDLFASFTHSLAELDATLRQIIEDAIGDGWNDGVSCTQAQWDAIKAIFDKSLYFNYNGVSLIKSFTDGIVEYAFGGMYPSSGYSLVFVYDTSTNLLFAQYQEV